MVGLLPIGEAGNQLCTEIIDCSEQLPDRISFHFLPEVLHSGELFPFDGIDWPRISRINKKAKTVDIPFPSELELNLSHRLSITFLHIPVAVCEDSYVDIRLHDPLLAALGRARAHRIKELHPYRNELEAVADVDNGLPVLQEIFTRAADKDTYRHIKTLRSLSIAFLQNQGTTLRRGRLGVSRNAQSRTRSSAIGWKVLTAER
jgi:hypothetical protein